ncbi:MAG: transcription elongation factor GreA, partial [Granulosicoccus sp.]
PLGKGLLGKEVGDIADVETPGGIIKFEIVKIAR